MNNWNKYVKDAFDEFVRLKYEQLTDRTRAPQLKLDAVTDTFGFPRGTRAEICLQAHRLRARVLERVVTDVWEDIPSTIR